jgi:hypothetical protein
MERVGSGRPGQGKRGDERSKESERGTHLTTPVSTRVAAGSLGMDSCCCRRVEKLNVPIVTTSRRPVELLAGVKHEAPARERRKHRPVAARQPRTRYARRPEQAVPAQRAIVKQASCEEGATSMRFRIPPAPLTTQSVPCESDGVRITPQPCCTL